MLKGDAAMEGIFLIGAGSYGDVIYDLAVECGYEVLGYYDDTMDAGTVVNGVEVLGPIKEFLDQEAIEGNYAVTIGNVGIRNDWFRIIRAKGGDTPSLVHPSSYVSPSAEIGEGVYIQPSVSIWTKVKIGDFCIVAPMSSISHHTVLGEGCFITPGCTIGSKIVFGRKVFVGMGSTVMSGVRKMGDCSFVGAGSLVIKDVDEGGKVFGSPAKVRE
ncbi:sugar O-acyltransferase, sialic acid O-acetyltransferase NeuD family [Dethiosulfatibacter aminovorans DSM 17477]|uniref:Sugar O-acyltransferase, sialic acid O-acetyltransferase NeuD family n=1 Tax=Dethiosulfatibacter aminovorans DSM 17477 TaxID=1121476 RepID=A0A1M6BIT8_9FIRM|nr:NeuD/PglB/VioB family sugar acetyltransferase [Dethiosulfatibacter aminovorans]SHI48652.1 sugar O-acyltransferase, sialic acid O-acetyltransferase NeuD family [Dethiosulfatibacter aminovorans DSM 17477]